MTPGEVLTLLRLPPASVLDRRVAKADLAERLPTPADRRLADERIDALVWHAALNAANTGLPAGHTPGLAIVTLSVRSVAARHNASVDPAVPPPRLLALIHRVVPDPLLLLTTHGDRATTLSIKPALGDVITTDLPDALLTANWAPVAAAAFAVDRAASLGELHDRWCAAVLALNAWRVTGGFQVRATEAGGTAARQVLLGQVIAFDADIRRLTAAAKRETQHRHLAELNQRLQHVRRQRQEAADRL